MCNITYMILEATLILLWNEKNEKNLIMNVLIIMTLRGMKLKQAFVNEMIQGQQVCGELLHLMRPEDGRTGQRWKIWIWQWEQVSKGGNFYTLEVSRYLSMIQSSYVNPVHKNMIFKNVIKDLIKLQFGLKITHYLNWKRWFSHVFTPSTLKWDTLYNFV